MQNLDPAVDDLSAVQADDLLLDLLGSAAPHTAGELDDLGSLMLAWRGDVESLGYGDLVDLDTAVAAIASATRSWWANTSSLKAAALVLLLAAIAIAIGGVL